MKHLKLTFLTVLCMGIVMFLAGPVCAAVTGECSNCHTMHNSQNGNHMMINVDIDGTSGGSHGGGYPSLTRGSCVGCHTGPNTAGSTHPYVYDTGAVNYGFDTLAGGNFKWVVTDDAKGHNVKGIPGMSADTLLAAPGDGGLAAGCTSSCHSTLFAPVDGAALNTGCEGCHLEPKHHAPRQLAGTPALKANGYFRFLSGHDTGSGSGVEGIEDDDWQFTNDMGDHNEYLGNAVDTHAATNTRGFAANGNTMTGFCTGCHGTFHTQLDGNANWIRHPSDAVLPSTGEYANYTTYDPDVPVARPDLTTIPEGGIGVAAGTDMVMCLSCHRAHGSPYDDMLRWDYSGMVAGNGGSFSGTGCFTCHSEKD